jgi:predicted SAM-dependent methyltransferase
MAIPFPRKLQIGSGNKFKEDFINIDINANKKTDLLMDIAQPIAWGKLKTTQRFGRVKLTPGCIDYILCEHVLEHIPNLVDAMTNCLELLADDGVMEIEVPYDLSYGAWMDPTHVRAFNELSWQYYCSEHAWYINWRTHCFDLVDHAYFIDSPYGQGILAKHNNDWDAVRPLPRVIERIRVKLKKRPYTADEIARFTAEEQ